MKDKVIFWMDSDLSDFGLAKSLQDLYDCELFAVVDIPDRPKKFFETQNLVNFNKIWFYHDHIIKGKKPDVSYLKSFEEKYGINLWMLAYNERIFFQFNEYYEFTTEEILSILEQECRLFENIIDEIKPDFLVTRITGLHHHHLFYELCRMKGVRVLMRRPSRFGYKCIISETPDKIDHGQKSIAKHNRSLLELENYLKKFDYFKQGKEYQAKFQHSQWQKCKAALQFLLIAKNTNTKTHYTYYGRSKLKVFVKEIIFSLKKRYREFFIEKNLTKNTENESPFIYFPLHVEPERVLLIGSPFYTNQLEIITNIVKSLPVGYKLFVKEHPLMSTRGWRKISFYKELNALPNVKVIHPSIIPEEMIKKSSLVISISGTSSLEAAFYGKPSIALTNVTNSPISSIYNLNSIENLPSAIRLSLKTNVNLSELNDYVDLVETSSFEFDMANLEMDYANYFYYGGFLLDVDIPISRMKSFLQESKNKYEKLAFEHIRKIKSTKSEINNNN